ncbi:hypothetical protein C8Q77DRAFT_1083896 [Trametes polyzona]|nr:hypothetical protein C8Q77DRAFT_1083896 [Trametes polyzona]
MPTSRIACGVSGLIVSYREGSCSTPGYIRTEPMPRHPREFSSGNGTVVADEQAAVDRSYSSVFRRHDGWRIA